MFICKKGNNVFVFLFTCDFILEQRIKKFLLHLHEYIQLYVFLDSFIKIGYSSEWILLRRYHSNGFMHEKKNIFKIVYILAHYMRWIIYVPRSPNNIDPHKQISEIENAI